MAMNLEAVLRIAAEVVGLDDITALEKGIKGAEQAASKASGAFKAVISSSSWQAAAAAATGFGVAIGLAAGAAIDFESSMADVRKVVDGLESPEAFAEMKAEILDLSGELPIAIQGITEIYAAAAQSGIAKEELKDFATLVAQVGIAFDITANDAGRSLSQLAVSLGLSTDEVRELADAMNYVSNNTGATAANLVEFMTRSGAVGELAGFSAQETVAFGAAMVQTGINTEVAATSFNNMVKALSKGPSMTDRQKSALDRLGYSMVDAQEMEKELTRVVEQQSQQRIDAAREETDELTKEINRRYRNQLQALQDTWDDEAAAYEDALQDRTDAQVKQLQRQKDQEIKAAEERAEITGTSADEEIRLIEDSYEKRIDLIRDATEKELTDRRRADRDRQQEIKDNLDDQKDLEVKAVDDRYKAIEKAEQLKLEEAKAAAKKTGEQLAMESAQGFADRFSKDAVGTTLEVLNKISQLPKSEQISVWSDLFGDETRGLAPLIANLGELERVLGLSAATGEYSGSVLAEFQTRAETAAAKIQAFQNNMTALQIVVGETVLPALIQLTEAFGPLLLQVADFAAENPGLTTALVAIGGIASALVLAAPFILSTITLLGELGVSLSAIGTAATFVVGAFQFAFGGLLTWVGSTLVPGLLAFFSGPVGWTVLAVAAVAAAAIAFQEPLTDFLEWLWEWGEPIREFWDGLWNGFRDAVSDYIQWVIGNYEALWEGLKDVVVSYFDWAMGIWEWGFEALYAIAWQLWVQPWINLWENVLREPVTTGWTWLQGTWGTIANWFTSNVTDPIGKAWSAAINGLAKPMEAAWEWLQDIWSAMTKWFADNVTDPIAETWEAVITALPDAMEAVVDTVNSMWNGMIEGIKSAIRSMLQYIADQINSVGDMVNSLIKAFNELPGPDISLVPKFTVPEFAEGGTVNRPTLAMVGEGSEREYIIPESKMQTASARYLSGARGADVIPASAGSVGSTGVSAPVINVTTGPVLEFDGKRYVRIEDFDRGMRQVADGVIGRLRTPAARIALGRA